MNLSTFVFLNQNFIEDLTKLNDNNFHKEDLMIFDPIIKELNKEEPINKNFDRVFTFLNNLKTNKAITPEIAQKCAQRILFFVKNYVDINNSLAEYMKKSDNKANLNGMLIAVFHNRYSNILPIIEKTIYSNPLQKELLRMVADILRTELGQICIKIETEFVPILTQFCRKLEKETILMPEDSYSLFSFNVGSGVAGRFFSKVFKEVDNKVNEEKKPPITKDIEGEKILEDGKRDSNYLKN